MYLISKFLSTAPDLISYTCGVKVESHSPEVHMAQDASPGMVLSQAAGNLAGSRDTGHDRKGLLMHGLVYTKAAYILKIFSIRDKAINIFCPNDV